MGESSGRSSSDGLRKGKRSFAAFAARNAVPFSTVEPGGRIDDLGAVARLVADARIVALGESSHTLREQQQLKHRIVRFLVEELGFSVVVLEDSLSCCARIDAWLRGGSGDAESLADGFGMNALWNTQEMLDFIRWMHKHNASREAAHWVRFYGLDIAHPAAGISAALDCLEATDLSMAVEIRRGLDIDEVFDDTDWPRTVRAYKRLNQTRRQAIETGLTRLGQALEGSRGRSLDSSALRAVEWAYRHVSAALWAHRMYVALADERWLEAVNYRDEAMADNVTWIARTAEPDAKIIIWTHNGHIARATRVVPDVENGGPMIPMGQHLAGRLPEAPLNIGMTFDRGTDRSDEGPVKLEQADEHSLDGAMACLGHRQCSLDLRELPRDGPARHWLSRVPVRYFQSYETMNVRDSFDVVLFVRDVTPTRRRSTTVE